MENNMDINETFTAVTADIEIPVADSLADAVDYYTSQDDLTITVDVAMSAARVAVAKIAVQITPTPSVRDIEKFMSEQLVSFLQHGKTVTDLSLIEAYVLAAYGFTGDELDEIDEYYGDLDEQETLY